MSHRRVYAIIKANNQVTSAPSAQRMKTDARWAHILQYRMVCWRARYERSTIFKCEPNRRPQSRGWCLSAHDTHNTVAVLLQAVKQFGIPAAIPYDSGSCFVGIVDAKPIVKRRATIAMSFQEECGSLSHLRMKCPMWESNSSTLNRTIPKPTASLGNFRGMESEMHYCKTFRMHHILQRKMFSLFSRYEIRIDITGGIL